MQLAQLNLAKMVAPLDSPEMAGFVSRLANVNARAEAAPGFIWRLKDDGDGATSIRIFEDNFLIVNMSVWSGPEALNDFVYKQSDHAEALKKRREWFESPSESMVACWSVVNGHQPTLDEARQKLELLRTIGSTADSFSLKTAADHFKP